MTQNCSPLVSTVTAHMHGTVANHHLHVRLKNNICCMGNAGALKYHASSQVL